MYDKARMLNMISKCFHKAIPEVGVIQVVLEFLNIGELYTVFPKKSRDAMISLIGVKSAGCEKVHYATVQRESLKHRVGVFAVRPDG